MKRFFTTAALIAGVMSAMAFETYDEAFLAGKDAAAKKNYRAAVSAYNEAFEKAASNPRKIAAKQAEGAAYFLMRKFPESVAAYKAATVLPGLTSGELEQATYMYAHTLQMVKQYPESEKVLSEAVKNDKFKKFELYDIYVNCMVMQSKFDEAGKLLDVMEKTAKNPNELKRVKAKRENVKKRQEQQAKTK